MGRRYDQQTGQLQIGCFIDEDGYPIFRAAISNITPAATPTDIFQLVPGATKTVRVRRYKITGFAGTAGQMPYRAERRSTANTGTKEVAFTVAKLDSGDPASTVTSVSYYSSAAGNPTATGAVVAVLDAGRLGFPSVTVPQPGPVYEEMTEAQNKNFTFRGVLDIFAITLTGAAVPTTGVYDLMVEWKEDAS
jgi:hypothetical protein